MFYQRVTAAISVVDAIFPRHDREHARGLSVRAHLSIQFVPKSARPPTRSPAHYHHPCRLWSRLSLISRESAARLVWSLWSIRFSWRWPCESSWDKL